MYLRDILLHFDFYFFLKKLVQGVIGKKLPSFLFSSEDSATQARSISGLLLKFAETDSWD